MEIQEISIRKFKKGQIQLASDFVSVEEPLEISIFYFEGGTLQTKKVSITMRTPGHDSELALGFLFTEAILNSFAQVEKIVCENDNQISIFIKKGEQLQLDKLDRNFYTTSSCGVCGKSSLDAIRTIVPKDKMQLFSQSKSNPLTNKIILGLREKINAHQSNFSKTGGIHASALFDMEGNLQSIFEDVGRHNALDKLIGHYFMEGVSKLDHHILLLSGRASFELIQKAVMADIQIICAIGAPSSLAVEMAVEFGRTLIGFLKEDSFNMYSGSIQIEN